MKKFYSLKSMLLGAMLTLGTATAFGQVTLAEWAPTTTNTPGGTGNFGPSPFTATTSAANITVGGLTRGSGILTPAGGSGAAAAWGGTDFLTTSAAAAITANDIVTFTIAANSGYKVSVAGIDAYNIRRSGTGSTGGQWQYQIGSGTFTNIGTPITWGTGTAAAGNEQPAIDLSGITALQNVSAGTTITFRLALYGATGTGGTWYINGNTSATSKTLTVKGIVAADPTMAVSDAAKGKANLVKNTIVSNEITFGASAKVSVYNTAGQLVKTAEVAENSKLDVSALPKGAYVVTGVVNGQTVSQKVIKK
jgi:hypothetical protein